MLLFCVKTIVKESCNFEKEKKKKKNKKKKKGKKKKKEKHGCLVTFWFGTSRYFFVILGMLFVRKTLEDEW